MASTPVELVVAVLRNDIVVPVQRLADQDGGSGRPPPRIRLDEGGKCAVGGRDGLSHR